MRTISIIIVLFTLLVGGYGCKKTVPSRSAETLKAASHVQVPTFCADSAYAFVAQQVAFGPRVPATAAHTACGNYLADKLTAFGAQVQRQEGTMRLYDGRTMALCNIIGSYNLHARQRILLCAHWDSRPMADQEQDVTQRSRPIDGANDGASGVGVLLEVARQLQQYPIEKIGVDIIFFDLEDWGAPENFQGNSEHSWCLGAQYWAKNLHRDDYHANYGILLDMVGGRGALFFQEQISMHFAPHIVQRVWQTAQQHGFDAQFVSRMGGAVTDDHLYINQLAGIPCIDIIQYDPNSLTGFAPYWHTHADNLNAVDSATLYVVGQTLLHVLYESKSQ